jgi:hypothetical protein
VVYTPLVMADGVVRRKCTGNPSGQVNTSDDNTLALISVAYYSFSKLMGTRAFLEAYHAGRVRFVANGDDFMMAIHKSLRTTLPEASLQALFKECGLTYEFSPYTANLKEMVYLGHSFSTTVVEGKNFWVPQLSSARIVASCVFRRRTDAISTQSRYHGAMVHALWDKSLYSKLGRLVVAHTRRSLSGSNFSTSSYDANFLCLGYAGSLALYVGKKVGSAGETYSHKNIDSSQRTLQSSNMSGHLERERGEDKNAFVEDDASEFGEAPDDGVKQLSHIRMEPGSGTVLIPLAKMDPTIASIFNSSVRRKPRQRFIVAKSSNAQVEKSLGNLRDLLSVDDEGAFGQVLVDFLVYYMDNSTSEQTPHEFPYEYQDKTVSFDDIDRCFVPTPRKFWRACADVTRNFLRSNEDVFPHWGNVHGFPKKHREFAFDTADFCTDIPPEVRRSIQSVKDVALSRSAYNMMRADLKAVGTGSGTIVKQIAGDSFSKQNFNKGDA